MKWKKSNYVFRKLFVVLLWILFYTLSLSNYILIICILVYSDYVYSVGMKLTEFFEWYLYGLSMYYLSFNKLNWTTYLKWLLTRKQYFVERIGIIAQYYDNKLFISMIYELHTAYLKNQCKRQCFYLITKKKLNIKWP